MSAAGPSFFSTFASAISTFLAFAMEVALLVIALTHVRQRRPDAAIALAIGAILHLVPTVLWSLFTTFVAPSLASSMGSGIAVVYAVATLFSTLLRTAGWAAILFGVVKLASPPSGAMRDPTRF